MENNWDKKTTYRIMAIGGIVFLLIRMWLDYQNMQEFKSFFKKQINHDIKFDKIRRGLRLIYPNVNLDAYDDDFSYCGSSEIHNELEDKVTPNSVRTKLFIVKDKNTNLVKTVINDTCYQFRVYADPGVFGKLFE